MGTKLYKPRRRKRKEKLYLIDKLEIGGIVIASAAIIAWSGWSVAEALKPAPVIKTYEVDTDTVSEYLANIDSNTADVTDADRTSKEIETDNATNTKEEKSNESSDTSNNKNDNKNDDKESKEESKKDQSGDKKKTKKTESKPKEQTKQETAIAVPANTDNAAVQMTPSVVPVYTAKEDLNVRKDPDPTVSNVVASYKAGEVINVTETDEKGHGGWYKVNKNGLEGYIAKMFVEVK